jgi:hypothetical protein
VTVRTADRKCNDSKSNDNKSNDSKSNDSKSNDSKSNDSKSNDSKSNDSKSRRQQEQAIAPTGTLQALKNVHQFSHHLVRPLDLVLECFDNISDSSEG